MLTLLHAADAVAAMQLAVCARLLGACLRTVSPVVALVDACCFRPHRATDNTPGIRRCAPGLAHQARLRAACRAATLR